MGEKQQLTKGTEKGREADEGNNKNVRKRSYKSRIIEKD
jgi:hypothetical protein